MLVKILEIHARICLQGFDDHELVPSLCSPQVAAVVEALAKAPEVPAQALLESASFVLLGGSAGPYCQFARTSERVGGGDPEH